MLWKLRKVFSLSWDFSQVIYDQLVKPSNSITNYHTDKSGITEALLQDVTTTLLDVQRRFVEVVPAEAILVGHALENDLKALKVVHMRCIDTGALYPHPKASSTLLFHGSCQRTCKIKNLTRKVTSSLKLMHLCNTLLLAGHFTWGKQNLVC